LFDIVIDMNLVFIYGPPAAGKLTVAKELAKLTGYTLFHNHLTRDLVQQLYPENLSEKYELVNVLRLSIFNFLAKHNTNSLFTYVYDGPSDDHFVNDVAEQIQKQNGKVLFVELRPTDEILLSRVDNESRKEFNKLVDKDALRINLDSIRYPSVPHANILRIDNSSIRPDVTAGMIVDYFSL
jgi:adenylate kinase family enzyme